jgi:hypothetical protein
MMMMSVLYKTNTLVGVLRSRNYNSTPDSPPVRANPIVCYVQQSDWATVRWSAEENMAIVIVNLQNISSLPGFPQLWQQF